MLFHHQHLSSGKRKIQATNHLNIQNLLKKIYWRKFVLQITPQKSVKGKKLPYLIMKNFKEKVFKIRNLRIVILWKLLSLLWNELKGNPYRRNKNVRSLLQRLNRGRVLGCRKLETSLNRLVISPVCHWKRIKRTNETRKARRK